MTTQTLAAVSCTHPLFAEPHWTAGRALDVMRRKRLRVLPLESRLAGRFAALTRARVAGHARVDPDAPVRTLCSPWDAVLDRTASVDEGLDSLTGSDCPGVLLVDGSGRLAGVFDERHALKVLRKRIPASVQAHGWGRRGDICVPASMRAHAADDWMRLRGLSHAVVLDERGRSMGLTSRCALAGRTWDRVAYRLRFPTPAAKPTDPLRSVVKTMVRSDSGAVVVLDARRHPVELLLARDLIPALWSQARVAVAA